MVKMSPVVRLISHVEKGPGGCWLWTAQLDKGGYGKVKLDGRPWMAHRAAYTLLVGPIPAGLTLDHLCRVRNCVNPDHLEPVTLKENLMRGRTPAALNSAKTACPQGHPYDEHNTYRWRGRRMCKKCQRASTRRWRQAHAYA